MDGISIKQRAKGNSREERERLDILAGDFGKLEESRKDYILELNRKLADIDCNGGCEAGKSGFSIHIR